MSTISFKELGAKFGKEFQVLQYKKIYSIKDLPKNNKIELVFWGKSNVGKSSLINTLLNYKINKVSRNPGCTRWIGFLELKNFNIIDLPGYSFAAVSKGRKDYFDKLFVYYIKTQRTNKLFLLIDSFKGLTEIDEDILSLFDCEKEILITKSERVKEESKYLQLSTKNGNGIIELRNKILEMI